MGSTTKIIGISLIHWKRTYDIHVVSEGNQIHVVSNENDIHVVSDGNGSLVVF